MNGRRDSSFSRAACRLWGLIGTFELQPLGSLYCLSRLFASQNMLPISFYHLLFQMQPWHPQPSWNSSYWCQKRPLQGSPQEDGQQVVLLLRAAQNQRLPIRRQQPGALGAAPAERAASAASTTAAAADAAARSGSACSFEEEGRWRSHAQVRWFLDGVWWFAFVAMMQLMGRRIFVKNPFTRECRYWVQEFLQWKCRGNCT